MNMSKKAKMDLRNGFAITFEQNPDTSYEFELFIDIEKDGVYQRQVAYVSPNYKNEDLSPTVVGDSFKIMVADSHNPDELVPVDNEGPSAYFTRRSTPEMGMIPSGMPLRDSTDLEITYGGVAVRIHPEDAEAYVGIMDGFTWHQNLLRLRVRYSDDEKALIRVEAFSEYERSYFRVCLPIALDLNQNDSEKEE